MTAFRLLGKRLPPRRYLKTQILRRGSRLAGRFLVPAILATPMELMNSGAMMQRRLLSKKEIMSGFGKSTTEPGSLSSMSRIRFRDENHVLHRCARLSLVTHACVLP